MPDPIQPSFLEAESGAVTVDWVVLTAALVGLGLAVMGVVSTGVQDVSGDMQSQLEADDIIATSFGAIADAAGSAYSAFNQLHYDGQYSGLMTYADGVGGAYAFSDADVLAFVASGAADAAEALSSGNQSLAQEYIDYAAASRDVAVARGIEIPEEHATIDATIAAYHEAYPEG
ncbi:hypothetical protein [Jannaschia ovalis]|uniref:Uncharacterized protein n=1 Tax=Jannaschia ovalis TaxID=3038773 RepID=A0ABY8LJX2_9RHOB|nr:hypothetical protein [Jannaschia sp. GRR-S6-38]WGH80443.1 hypothetical protein P8627_15785 [Jannaschia sp. GRR-S6-38]